VGHNLGNFVQKCGAKQFIAFLGGSRDSLARNAQSVKRTLDSTDGDVDMALGEKAVSNLVQVQCMVTIKKRVDEINISAAQNTAAALPDTIGMELTVFGVVLECRVDKCALDPKDATDLSKLHTISIESGDTCFEVIGVCSWHSGSRVNKPLRQRYGVVVQALTLRNRKHYTKSETSIGSGFFVKRHNFFFAKGTNFFAKRHLFFFFVRPHFNEHSCNDPSANYSPSSTALVIDR
jgi:hypothetical protein